MLNTFSYTCRPFVNLFWRNVYASPLHIFLQRLFFVLFCFWAVWVPYFFWLLTSNQMDIWLANSFFHSVSCLFTLVWRFSLLCRRFLVWYYPTCLCLLLLPVFWGSYPRNLCQDQCYKKNFPYVFLLEFCGFSSCL